MLSIAAHLSEAFIPKLPAFVVAPDFFFRIKETSCSCKLTALFCQLKNSEPNSNDVT
ncbi:hypothetical protein DAI22_05g081000 [Oryza sativa Japonica Group]|nr:hypothetical protein DAI22_05g081000 [Oryza sativa Japonica Group]